MTKNKAKIFFSYSHKDEALREQLNSHLSILRRNELIEEWHDRKIITGQNWQSEIDKQLNDSDIVILLISPDFIASEYCYGNELKKAIERHEANQSIVIPIIVRPVNWSDAPFSKIQALPRDARAVTTWPNIDEAWLNVSEEIQKAIADITKLKNRKRQIVGLKQVSKLLELEADRIDQIYQKDSTPYSGVPTGINDLDSAIDGIHSTDLMLIASRPENGADDLVVNIAKNVSIDAGLPVAYYSFQTPSDRLTRKLICAIGGLNHYNLLRGLFEEEDWSKLTNALSKLNDAPLYIDDSSTVTLEDLIKNVKELKANTGALALIIIDSLQSLFFQNNTKVSIEHYSKSLKYLAKELQTPIIVTSNLSSEAEHRPNKRPVIKDLGDWRDIQEDADIILLTYVDEIYDWDSPDKGTVELLIEKNVYGPQGMVRAIYTRENTVFANLKGSEYI